MELVFKHLDQVCSSITEKNTTEESISHILNNLANEVGFQSLGIYHKIQNEENFQIKINRNISYQFVKNSIITPEDKIITDLENNPYLHCNENKAYKFEYEYSDLLIFPLLYKGEVISFVFLDREEGIFTESEIAKLQIYMSILSFVQRIHYMKHTIERLNETDDVTGLLNHRSFVKLAHKNHSHMHRYKREYSLAVCKINKFEEMAKTLGNQKVPVYLQEIARIIFKNIRDTDFAGVLYPDTFGIFFTEINKEVAKMVIDRIHNGMIRSSKLTGMQFKWGINDNRNSDSDFNLIFKQTDEALQDSIRSVTDPITIYNGD